MKCKCGHEEKEHFGPCEKWIADNKMCECERFTPVSDDLQAAASAIQVVDHIMAVVGVWLQHTELEGDPFVDFRQRHNDIFDKIVSGYASECVRKREPIDVVLFCPSCKFQHIDKAEPDVCETCGHPEVAHARGDLKCWIGQRCSCTGFTAWLNPPHKSHRCLNCNIVWRPADVPTNGVAKAKTVGSNDTKDYGVNPHEQTASQPDAHQTESLEAQ
jgi:hypothetical protein